MPCFHPLEAWQLDGGEIVFAERGKILRSLTLPCGRCIGCRLEKSRQWAVRCMHESQCHEYNSFVTLTFDDDNVPHNNSLEYGSFQRFLKRLRKWHSSKVRFYMCGEYGETTKRPHFHACLFGVFFDDREVWKKSGSGSTIYTSEALSRLWPFGFSSVGDVTFESAAYVSRYITKKVTGPAADDHYRGFDSHTGEVVQLTPEFARMSLKPGIGALWYDKYKKEVYPNDEIVMRGAAMKPPRYYDKLLEREPGYMSDDVAYQRYLDSLGNIDNGTVARLAVREKCTEARLKFKSRSL